MMPTFHFVRFAPNGNHVSFTAGQGGGRSEVYVQAYPQGSPIQVSRAGGEEAMWSADGREIFFRNGDAWLVAPVEWEPQVKIGEPRILFRGPYSNVPGYGQDVTPDGQRFLMLLSEHADRPVTELRVIVNWVEDLKRRVPVGPSAPGSGGR